MADDQSEIGDRPDLEQIKQLRREHPSGWLELSMTPARALLIDAVIDSPPGHEFTTGTISERAGISPQAVRDHIDVLIDRGVVEATDGTPYRIVDDSVVLMELEQLNSAVTAVRSGEQHTQTDNIDPDRRADNATTDGSTAQSFGGSTAQSFEGSRMPLSDGPRGHINAD